MSMRAHGRRLSTSARNLFRKIRTPQAISSAPIFELQPLEQRLFLTASPSISVATNNPTEGSTVTFNLASNDNDGEGIDHWAIDWGDGNSSSLAGDPSSADHTYAEAGHYSISASVTENGTGGSTGGDTGGDTGGTGGGTGGTPGGTYSTSGSIDIAGIAPVVSVTGASSVTVGSSYTASIATSQASGDTDADSISTIVLDWGDGNTVTYHATDYTGGVIPNPLSATHTYTTGANRTLLATATDDDSLSGTGSQSITVGWTPPIPYISGDYQTSSGGSYTLNLQNLAANSSIDQWTINWGDGSPLQTVSGSATTAAHTFLDPVFSDVITASASLGSSTYAANRLPIVVRAGATTDPPSTNVAINFQPFWPASNYVIGALPDMGHVFADNAAFSLYSNDYCFGWDNNYSDAVSTSNSADIRYASYMPMQANGVNRTWSIGLPNGTYSVHIVAGDGATTTNAYYQMIANGTTVINGAPSTSSKWLDGVATVSVTGKRLIVTNGASALNNKIAFIEITPTTHSGLVPSAPTSLTATAEAAAGTGNTTGIVNLNWSDAADNETGYKVYRSTNGSTYAQIATLPMNAIYYGDGGLTNGATYYYRVVATNATGDSTVASTSAVTPSTNAEAPYGGTAWTVPGRIEAENFDSGGSGVAYSDADSANDGVLYRNTSVDIGPTGPGGTGYMVGWTTAATEYLKYTFNATATGTYRLDVSVASNGVGGTFHVELDGTNVSGTMSVPDTGGWLNFQTLSKEGINITTTGTHVLRLVMDGTVDNAVANFDWLQLTASASATPSAPANLSASPGSGGEIILKWQNTSSNVTGYVVQRWDATSNSYVDQSPTLASTATAYNDSSAAANTLYQYRVAAVNAQGESYPSNSIAIVTPILGSVALNPTADTYTDQNSATSNFGSATELGSWQSGTSHDRRLYLRFDASAVTGTITGAKLRLFGRFDTRSALTGITLDASGVADTSTLETTTNWNTAPTTSTFQSTATVSTSGGQWYEWDISSWLLNSSSKIITVMVQPSITAALNWGANSREFSVEKPVLLVNRVGGATPVLSSTSATTSQISLAWTYTGTETGYYLERSTDGATYSRIYTVVGAQSTYTDTGLTAGTRYWYRVQAYGNSYGESPYSNALAVGTTAPTPSSLSAGAISSYQITLTWANGAGNQSGITIQRATNSSFTNPTTITLSGSPTSYTDSPLSASTTYYYQIRANGPGASSPWIGAASATTQAAPNGATNLAASVRVGAASQSVHLTWTDNSTNETGFQIQRSTSSSFSSPTIVATTAANITSYDDPFVSAGTVYWYRIVVMQGPNGGTPSNVVKTALPQVATLAPTEGVAFSGTVASFTDSTGSASDYTISINWGDGNTTSGAIARDPNNSAAFLISGSHTYAEDHSYAAVVNVTHTADSVQSFTSETASVADAALSMSTATVNASIGVPFSGVVATFTDGNPSATVSDYTATIDWNDGRGAVAVVVQTNPAGGFEVVVNHTWESAGTNSFVVTVHDKDGSTAGPLTISPTGLSSPAGPAGLSAHADYATPSSQVDLSWYNAVGTQTGIYVERSTDDVNFTRIATLTGTPTAYQDTTVSAGTTYYYRIQSYGSTGSSAYDGPVAVTTAGGTVGAPTALSITGGTYVQEGQSLTLSAAATPAQYTDPNNYVWTVSKDGKVYDTGRGVNYTFSPNRSGNYLVTVTLLNANAGLTTSQAMTVVNIAPQNVAISGPAQGQQGHVLTFVGTGVDPGGASDPLTCQWTATRNGSAYSPQIPDGSGGLVNAITNLSTFAFMPSSSGTNDTYILTLSVTDTDGAKTTKTQTVVVTPGTGISGIWTKYSYNTNLGSYSSDDSGTGTTIVDLGNGKILVAGHTKLDDTNYDRVFVSRFNVNGGTITPDYTFGAPSTANSGGHTGTIGLDLAISVDRFPYWWSIRPGLVVNNNQIYVTGGYGVNNTMEAAVARLNADGTPDTHFGTQGYAWVNSSSLGATARRGTFTSLVVQADGSIVAAGSEEFNITTVDVELNGKLLVAKFNSDGTLDATFGNQGVSAIQLANEVFTYTPLGDTQQTGYGDEGAVSIFPYAGKYIVGAITSTDWIQSQGYAVVDRRFTVARLTSTGGLDTTFGNSGVVVTTIPQQTGDTEPSDDVMGNLFLVGNKFVAVGSRAGAAGSSTYYSIAAVRYNDDGTLDTSFNSTGIALVGTTSSMPNIESDDSIFASGGADQNGNIIVGGSDGTSSFLLARLTPSGSLDPNFAASGQTTLSWNTGNGITVAASEHGIAVQPDGTTFVTGSIDWSGESLGEADIGVARYQPPVNAADQLVATAQADGAVGLEWRDNGATEDGFVIQRSVDGTHFVTVGYALPNQTTFLDTTVSPSAKYTYQVFAYWGTHIQSAPYSQASVQTGDPNAGYAWGETVAIPVDGSTVQSSMLLKAGQQYMLVASGFVDISSSYALHGDAEYGMFNPAPQAEAPAGPWGPEVKYGIGIDDPSGPLGLTMFPYWGAPATDPNHTYTIIYTPTSDEHITFKYHDNDYNDNSEDPSKDPAVVPFSVQIYTKVPKAPTGLTATADRQDVQVNLTWNGGSSGQLQTQIERATDGGSFAIVTDVPGNITTWTDTSVQINHRYSYRVLTSAGSGNSGYSNESTVLMANSAPVFDVTPMQMAAWNSASPSAPVLDFYVHAVDPDSGDTVTYSFTPGTNTTSGGGFTITTITSGPHAGQGELTATLTPDSQADFPYKSFLTIYANDNHGAAASQLILYLVPGPNQTLPTIVSTSPSSSTTVTGASLQLSAQANEGGSTDGLVYDWRVTQKPVGVPDPEFSDNDTASAANTTITFGSSGSYVLNLYVQDASGVFTRSADIAVTVNQTLSKLAISPNGMTLAPGGQWPFLPLAYDQFGNTMAVPSALSWSAASGTMSSSGMYTAPSSGGGVDTIQVSYGSGAALVIGKAAVGIQSATNSAPVVATAATATQTSPTKITLSVLGADDAGEENLNYTWSCTSGQTVSFQSGIQGTNTGKQNIATISATGTYTFHVSITDSGGLSPASGTPDLTSVTIIVSSISGTQTASGIMIVPASSSIVVSGHVSLTAIVYDQFRVPMATQPTSGVSFTSDRGVSMTTSYAGGTIGTTYIAPSTDGSDVVHVSYGSFTATAIISVVSTALPVAKLTMPADSGPVTIDQNTNVQAVVINPLGGSVTWTLTATPESGNPITLAQGSGTLGFMPRFGATIATLRPSLLPPGSYTLTLTAQNAQGSTSDSQVIQVNAPLQSGDFTLPVTDLTIPTGGLPITVTRTYDSSRAQQTGDFGYGWTMDLPSVNFASSAAERGDVADDPANPAYADGNTLSFSLPGGGVEQFAFTPVAVSGQTGQYTPAFTAVGSGVGTLTVSDAASVILSRGDAGEYFVQNSSGSFGYNPASSTFNDTFTLTTRNGTVIIINAASGMIQTITDANKNQLDYTHFFDASNARIISQNVYGSTSVNVVTVAITRSGGHISSISDPAGNSIQYGYDSAGNLTSVTDRRGNITTYVYNDGLLPHYITAVKDARGIGSVNVTYNDSTGQLSMLTDAAGNSIPLTSGPLSGQAGQTITDLDGNTSETLYDDRGDVTRTIADITDDQGKLIGYQVTARDYHFNAADVLDKVTDYLPFVVDAPDDNDVREQQAGTTVAQITQFYTPQTTGVSASNWFLPSSVMVFGGNNTARVTSYSGYVNGKPSSVVVTLQQLNTDGSVASTSTISTTSSTFDGAGNTFTSTDAAGNESRFLYNTAGQPIETYRVPVGFSDIPANRIVLATSTYLTSTDPHAGSIAGLLASSTDANGKTTFYTYTKDGNVARKYYLYNGVWSVETTVYDANGNTIATRQARYTDGGTSNVLDISATAYDSDGYPSITETLLSGTSVVTATQTGYDVMGNSIFAADQYDNRTYSDHDLKGNIVQTRNTHKLTDSSGNAITVSGAANNGSGLIRITTSAAHGLTTGNQITLSGIAGTTEANGVWTITVIDSTHFDLQASVFAHTFGSSAGRIDVTDSVQRSTFDPMGRVVWQTDPYVPGTSDAGGNGTHTLYDSLGQVISTERYSNVLIAIGTQTFGGVPLSASSLTSTGTLLSTTHTYYDQQGRVVETDDAAGLRTGTTYYPNGQIKYTGILAAGSPVGGTYALTDYASATSYIYDQVDSSITSNSIARYFNTVTDPNGWITKTYYDALARAVKTVYPDGTSSQTIYGLDGQAVSGHTVSGQTIDGYQITEIDQLTNGTDKFYDRAGNLTDLYLPAVLDADTASSTYNTFVRPHWRYAYDSMGNLTSTTDPRGNVTSNTYDALGDQITRALPLLPGQTNHATQTTSYDSTGNKTRVVDFNGNTSVYSYYTSGPSAGMISEIDYYLPGKVPGTDTPTQTVTYGYDLLGRQTRVADSTDALTIYTYDADGNTTSVTRSDSSSNVLSAVHYVYDPATDHLIETWTGSGSSDATSTTETLYGYDRQGRLESVTAARQNGAAPTLSSSNNHRFSAAGASISTTLPTTLYSYDNDGNVTQVLNPNGTETDYDFTNYWSTAGGQEIVTNWRGGNSGTKLSQFTYSFDADRRKTSDIEYVGDSGEGLFSTSKITWGYDADNRLTSEVYDYNNDDASTGGKTADDYTNAYAYDLANNRITLTHDASSDGVTDSTETDAYNSQNELTSQTTKDGSGFTTRIISSAYDANGSLIQTQQTSYLSGRQSVVLTTLYVYDARNRLIRIDPNDDTTYDSNGNATGYTSDDTTYTYDDNDNRLSETTNGTTTTSILDSQNPTGYPQVLESWQGGTTPATTYLLGKQILAQNANGTISYLVPDGHGSTRELTAYTSNNSTNGRVTARYDYDAFGSLITYTVSSHSTNASSTSVLYAGSLLDPASSMYRMGAAGRDYSAAIGRFSTADSYIAPPGDIINADPYVFVGGNPINLSDKNGHSAAGLLLTVAQRSSPNYGKKPQFLREKSGRL